MTEQTEIKKTFIQGILTPQTVVYLLGGMIALVVFWIRTKESWDKVKQLEAIIEILRTDKADKADLKAIDDRVGRQYDASNKISERTTVLEKQSEYQRGLADGKKQTP